MAYTARKQGLGGAVGAPNAPTGPQVDVAGAIDALTGGAQSLIHATMLRKQNEAALKTAADDKAYQRQQQEQDRTYQHNRDNIADSRYADELQFKQDEARRKFIIDGGVPEHTEMTPTPTTAQVPMAQPTSPIARAMQPPAPGKNGLPAPSFIPQGAPAVPATAPLPASTTTRTTVPEHVDPNKAVSTYRATETARIRGEQTAELEGKREAERKTLADQKIKAAQDAAVVAQKGRMELERLRQAGKSANAVRKPMTANAYAATANATADGLIASHGGDREQAYAWLNSEDPEAVKLKAMEKDLPVTWGTYLDNARAKWATKATQQTLSMQHATDQDGNRLGAREAAATVDSTRRIFAPKPPASKPAATPTAAAPAPAKVSSKAPATPAPADDFTDAELDAALDAGKEKPEDVRAYIMARRKTKPAKKP